LSETFNQCARVSAEEAQFAAPILDAELLAFGKEGQTCPKDKKPEVKGEDQVRRPFHDD
jgi:hypothetical protein